MTDIVERLRDPNKWAGTSDSDHNPLPSHAMALEAADKIEFLMKTHDDMSDEIERLRKRCTQSLQQKPSMKPIHEQMQR